MKVRRAATWTAVGVLGVCAVHGETLFEQDGIMLEGMVRMVAREAGVCQVLEANESPESYERMKANHGQPLHVWRMDFGARNGSGRRLEQLTANFKIDSEWPPCTNWTGPEGRYAKPVQWAGSFEVLQRPSGMQPGEEVADTVFVLAFHDREPRFENWQVDYRFAGGAESVADPPAFIVVPLPRDAQVTLLNAGEPYRRRMPLEPGRYELEVSAPGYATRRVWVDHSAAGVHRVELVPLAGDGGTATAGLPPEIQVDLHLRKAEAALREGDTATAREAMERVASLQAAHGLEPAAEDHYRHAQAWAAAGEPHRALQAAVRYLRSEGRDAEHYTEALDLINRDGALEARSAPSPAVAARVGPGTSPTPPPAAPEPRAGASRVFGGTEFVRVPAEEQALVDALECVLVKWSNGFHNANYDCYVAVINTCTRPVLVRHIQQEDGKWIEPYSRRLEPKKGVYLRGSCPSERDSSLAWCSSYENDRQRCEGSQPSRDWRRPQPSNVSLQQAWDELWKTPQPTRSR